MGLDNDLTAKVSVDYNANPVSDGFARTDSSASSETGYRTADSMSCCSSDGTPSTEILVESDDVTAGADSGYHHVEPAPINTKPETTKKEGITDVIEAIKKGAEFIASEKPEMLYVAAAITTEMQALDASHINNFAANDVMRACNYAGGACQVIEAATTFLDDNNPDKKSQKIKSVVLAASGMQAIAISVLHAVGTIGSTLVLGAAGVIGYLVDVGLSLEQTITTTRRENSFTYWLKNSLEQFGYNQERLQKLYAEQGAFPNDNLSTWQKLKKAHCENQIQEIKKQQKQLETEISARYLCREQFSKGHHRSVQWLCERFSISEQQAVKWKKDFTDMREMKWFKEPENPLRKTLTTIMNKNPSTQLQTAILTECAIQKKLASESWKTQRDTLIKGIRVAAAVLILVPGLQAIGAAMLGFTFALSAIELGLKATKKLKSVVNSSTDSSKEETFIQRINKHKDKSEGECTTDRQAIAKGNKLDILDIDDVMPSAGKGKISPDGFLPVHLKLV